MSYQVASLFHMYIDMGERIAGKQDKFSLIIEDPLRAPKIPPKLYIFLTFLPINEKMVFKLFPIVVHMFYTVMRSAFADILVPLVPLDFMQGLNMTPKKIKLNYFYFFHILYFNSKGSYQIGSIFDM